MYVALNISSNSIRVLEAGRRQVKRWGSGALEPGLVRDGIILRPGAVGAAIRTLLNSMKVSRKRVICCLTGLSFTQRVLTLPSMDAAALEEAIKRAAKREMPLPLEEMYLSWQAIGRRRDELDYLVVGAPSSAIDAVIESLIEAELKPYIMDLKPLALARAAGQEDALIVALEPDCFDIIIVSGGTPAIMHSMIPRGRGSLEDNIRRLADELSKTVKYYNESHQEQPLDPRLTLLVTGEMSSDAVRDLLQAEVEYPVESFVAQMKCPSEMPLDLYSTEIGLALRKAKRKAPTGSVGDYRDVSLNLLPDKYRAKGFRLPVRRTLLSLTAIIAIASLVPTYQTADWTHTESVRLEAELTRRSGELHELRLALNQAQQIENKISETTSDLEALRSEHQQMLSRRGDMADYLTLLAGALPPGASFASIEIGADRITVAGESEDFSTVISYAKALETLKAFSDVRIAEIGGSIGGKAGDDESAGGGISFVIVISKHESEGMR